jgi:ribonuclease-3
MGEPTRSGGTIDPEALSGLIRERTGYEFCRRGLMMEALTHKSWLNEQAATWRHNERLEFLGDAVLDLIISEHLMSLPEALAEGQLTRCRAALVNEHSLAQVAGRMALGDLLLLGRGEEKNNGRDKPSILSDGLEALIGAVFLDSNFATCREVVLRLFETEIGEAIPGDGLEDAKTTLQQALQAENRMPVYHTVDARGPDHDRTYEVEITVDGRVLGRGAGKSKKDAEKEAARRSLEQLNAAAAEESPCAEE